MSNILIINITIPFPANYNGNTVRVLPLSQELAKNNKCFLAVFSEDSERESGLKKLSVYNDILLLPPANNKKKLYRHLFFRTGHLYKVCQPDYYQKTVSAIRQFIEKNSIDLIIVHTLQATEFVEPFHKLPIIIDDIDCRTLSLTRSFTYASNAKLSWIENFLRYRQLCRARFQESRLTRLSRYVTTVSPIDRDVLIDLNKSDKTIVLDIPNGVSKVFTGYIDPDKEMPRTIAFWGALDFPPNNSAVHYFYENVFVPYLSESDITWYIIGKNANTDILEMAVKHKNIIVTGYIDDLFSLVSRIPIMINTMQMGGGLKNKVLEAFALGRLVISNAMGIEAIPAQSGMHYIKADDPQEIALKILHYLDDLEARENIGKQAMKFVLKNYSWESIGKKFDTLIKLSLTKDIK